MSSEKIGVILLNPDSVASPPNNPANTPPKEDAKTTNPSFGQDIFLANI